MKNYCDFFFKFLLKVRERYNIKYIKKMFAKLIFVMYDFRNICFSALTPVTIYQDRKSK